ncbi:MAG: hypothetical protein KC488_15345 [Candidatus Cloacimonetes bacterium]|nr:hypothetical protein [Candidatus Cloacimonadota bacterium]
MRHMIALLGLLLVSGLAGAQDIDCGAGSVSWTYSRIPFPLGFAGTIAFSGDNPAEELVNGLPVVNGGIQGDGTGAEQFLAVSARTRGTGLVDALVLYASSATAMVPGPVPSPSSNTGWIFISGASDFTLPDSTALDSLNQDNALEFLSYITAEHKIAGVFNSFSISSRSASGVSLTFGSGLGADVNDTSFLVSLGGSLTLYALPGTPALAISLGDNGLELSWNQDPLADDWLVEAAPEAGAPFLPLQVVASPGLVLGFPAADSLELYRVTARRTLPF